MKWTYFWKHNSLPKVKHKGISNLNRTNTTEIKFLIKKNLLANKSPGSDDFIVSIWPNIWGANLPQTILKKWKGENISKFILWDHHYPNIKTKKKYYKNYKSVSLINIDAKILNNPNLIIYGKKHTTWSRGIYSRDVRGLFRICILINGINDINKRGIKITWSFQYMQKKYLTKFNVHSWQKLL